MILKQLSITVHFIDQDIFDVMILFKNKYFQKKS